MTGGGGGGVGGLQVAGSTNPGQDIGRSCGESDPGLLWSRSASISFNSPRIVCEETGVFDLKQQHSKSGLH